MRKVSVGKKNGGSGGAEGFGHCPCRFGSRGQSCPGELWVVVHGSSPEKKKAAVRTEPADTQEYEAYVAMDESKEELTFVPSAVSNSGGWHKFYDIASIMVEGDGEPHTLNLYLKCPQFKAKRKKGTNDKHQAAEASSR